MLECKVCLNTFTNSSQVISHMQLLHASLRNFKCFFHGCDILFTTINSLKTHVKRNHTLQEAPNDETKNLVFAESDANFENSNNIIKSSENTASKNVEHNFDITDIINEDFINLILSSFDSHQ